MSALPRSDALIASGELQVRSTGDVYGAGRELDPIAQVEAFRRELDTALAGGHMGLRVAADITELARAGLETRRQLHVYERLADTLIDSERSPACACTTPLWATRR